MLQNVDLNKESNKSMAVDGDWCAFQGFGLRPHQLEILKQSQNTPENEKVVTNFCNMKLIKVYGERWRYGSSLT